MDVELTNRRVVAVDGGTASGKGRLVDELARLLREKGIAALHLSTGSLYRGVTFAALEYARQHVLGRRTMEDAELIAECVARVRELGIAPLLRLAGARRIEMHGGAVWLDGAPADVEAQLKGPGVGTVTPHVASFPEVREFVNVATRRQINEFDGYLLIDGRDIGHVVAPDAPLKLFLTVSPEIGAKRSIEHSAAEISARDAADRAHKHGALLAEHQLASEVHVIVTDNLAPEDVRNKAYRLMRRAWPALPKL
jgi:cytidylate kinase